MAFIKRSTQSVPIKVGKTLLQCTTCGKPFISNVKTQQCPACSGLLCSDKELPSSEPEADSTGPTK